MLLGVRDASPPNPSSGATSSLASGGVAIDFSVFLATSVIYDAGTIFITPPLLHTLTVAQSHHARQRGNQAIFFFLSLLNLCQVKYFWVSAQHKVYQKCILRCMRIQDETGEHNAGGVLSGLCFDYFPA